MQISDKVKYVYLMMTDAKNYDIKVSIMFFFFVLRVLNILVPM